MKGATVKVTVSLPKDLFGRVERFRNRIGRSRSALFQDALHFLLEQKRKAALIAEYEEGYRRMPESSREVKAAEAAAVRLLASEEW
jgi:metal-responsive CopG/Arc/MetJ family transcriptional regulator